MKVFKIIPVLLVLLCSLQIARAQKLKAEEIIAKHIEAIGGTETVQSVTSRISSGDAVVTFTEPGTGRLGGRAVLASEGPRNVVAMVFDNATNYPHEKVGFDGRDVSGSYVRPGQRSTLGDFLLTHKAIIKQGIFGGALSQSWALLDPARNKVKGESSGTKKINNRLVHQLKLYPSGSDLKISVYFDAETFQHIRTEYERAVVAQMGATPEASANQSETRYKMTEDFSDFKQEGGLTLPHAYKIHLEILGRSGSFKADWEMALSDFQFNQRIDPTSFDVDGNN